MTADELKPEDFPEPHQQRAVSELQQLNASGMKLSDFLQRDGHAIDVTERTLMEGQLAAMKAHSTLLALRIALWRSRLGLDNDQPAEG